MRIELALFGIIISIAGMLLLARKWNIATPPNQIGIAIFALIVAIPFLWIYPFYTVTLTRIFCLVGQVLLTFLLVFSIVFYRFWRDPERSPVENKGVIVSSADGKVIYIRQIPQDTIPMISKNGQDYTLHELMGIDLADEKKGLIAIGIEMNLMNVHVNRCPIEGDVKLIRHIRGNFYSLRKVEAPFLNTRCTTLISNKELAVATVQIASRLVRRVDNYLRPGQSVCLGQRLGMIRFGSLVAIIFPDQEDLKVEAFVGQKTLAGISIIARYNQKIEPGSQRVRLYDHKSVEL